MQRRARRRNAPLAVALVAALLAVGAELFLGRTAPFRRLEGALLDLRFRLAEAPPPNPAIVLVLIDDASLAELGRWPWPRSLMAECLDRLSEQRPRAVALDILFADADPGGDEALAAALKRAGDVALATSYRFGGPKAAAPDFLAASAYPGWRADRAGRTQVALEAAALAAPIPELGRAAAALGHVTVAYDVDGAVRYAYPVLAHAGVWQPSLPVALARIYLGLAPDQLWIEFGQGVHVGDRFLPTDEAMRAPFVYRRPGEFRSYSFVDVLKGRVPEGALRNAAVLIGAAASGLGDAAPTPFAALASGVERHAMAFDSLIGGHVVIRRDGFVLLDAVVILSLAALIGFAARGAGVAGASMAYLALTGGFVAANLLLFARDGIWLNLFTPVLALTIVYAAAAFSAHAQLAGERRAVRDAFRHYLHPRLVEELAREPGRLRLGGESRELTVLFADIRNFTGLAERLEPERLVLLLNRYFTAMTRAVQTEDGMVDKFLGDGLLAVFGAPLPRSDHAARGCRAALAMREALAELNASWATEGLPILEIGVGVNTGRMVIGNMGSEQRLDYTVVGDEVNIAARLEAASKHAGATILVSGATLSAAGPGFCARELTGLSLRGRSTPVRVFALEGRSA
jgi:adenylate cyclase